MQGAEKLSLQQTAQSNMPGEPPRAQLSTLSFYHPGLLPASWGVTCEPSCPLQRDSIKPPLSLVGRAGPPHGQYDQGHLKPFRDLHTTFKRLPLCYI